MKKLSKEQDYLATIKRNHKILTQVECEKSILGEDKIFKHLRLLKNAHRLSSFRLLQPYSVAEHCYYTGLLFETISEYENIQITKKEIYYVYRHDIIETITGDVLLTVKIHSKTTKQKWAHIEKEIICNKYPYLESFLDEYIPSNFSKEAWMLFKACDLFELYLFCLEEIELGNNTGGISVVIHNCANLLPEFKINYITERIV
ncbi:hypothetical protein LCGC14_0521370 [marine sediment metagenome]|uniref:HD domain-containing protein n=1 Tax=marine sediment metagenome TaxID=412755 RepID=A0A0F9SGT6_9ZZZZ